MKANLELRNAHTHEYLRRLGKVFFIIEYFAEPGSRTTKIWKVNRLHEFKKWGAARDFMSTEADRIGGGDTTGEENYRAVYNNHIHSWELEDAAI